MVHRSSYTRMRVLSLSAVSILLFFFIMIFGSGVQAADDHAPIYMPILKEIHALNADGKQLPLHDGTVDLVIRDYPGWKCTRDNYNSSGSNQPGYLMIPDGTASLQFVFYDVCPVTNKSLDNFNSRPKISYKNVEKQIESSSNPILTFTMEELSGTTYDKDNLVELAYKYGSRKVIGPPADYPQRARCYFRILSESDVNLWIQEPETKHVDRSDKYEITLYGKTSDNQKMDLWYQYTKDEEVYKVLYDADVNNGKIPVDLSRIQVGDITPNDLHGDFYWVQFYTEIDDVKSVKSNLANLFLLKNSSGKITEVGLSQKTGTYPQASLWVNVGAEFKPSVQADSNVAVYLASDKEGTEVIVEGFNCTVADIPSVRDAENCSNGKLRGLHIPSGMNPNTYYIIMKLTEPASEEGGEPVVTIEAVPFTVYNDANAYVKAALDKTLHWYATTSGNGGFINKDGVYVGNTEATISGGGNGIGWQAWIFPALGTAYPFDDSLENKYLFHKENNPEAQVPDTVDGKLSFATDGPFLSNQKNGDNFLMGGVYSEERHSAGNIKDTDLAVVVISLAAAGEDPRAAGENDFNLLHEMIRMGYKNYDIEAGKLNINPDTGHLSFPSAGFGLAYALVGLEICNATPEEGYTVEYRRAGAKALLDMVKSFNDGNTPLLADTVGMMAMPLQFMTDDEVYGEEIKAELAKMGETTEKSLYANGGIGTFVSDNGESVDLNTWVGNANSMAVMINALVMAGNDAEKIGSWQKEYGTALTAFIGTQSSNGTFSFPGAVSSWMATYQALGALVDLYNGKSYFAVDQENYFNKYPMYTDEGDDLLKELKGITDDVNTNKDVAEITAARVSYDAFLKDLSEDQTATVVEYYGKVVDLAEKEDEAVGYVGKLIDDLPPYEVVKPSDKAAAENAREAYEALSDAQQDEVDGYEDLLRVENQFNVIAAKNVETMMFALPDDDQVTVFDRGEVEAARAAYDGLTEDQKAQVDGAAYGKLTAAERALLKLNAQDVVEAIDELPSVEDLKWTDKRFVEDARAAYDVLTDKQKAYVTNVDKLEALEIRLAELADERLVAEDMKDLDKDAWYMNEVSWAIDEGFFNGDNNGNFNPNQYIKRAEFAQMLYNYYQNDAAVMKNGKTVKYNDVAADAWYNEAVSACSKAGIFKGDTNGNFNPNAPIRRQDAALVLMRIFIGEDAINAVDVDARLAELAEAGLKFADFDETSGYAQKAMAAAAGFIFNGDQNGELNPTSNITRAETATVLYNYFNTK